MSRVSLLAHLSRNACRRKVMRASFGLARVLDVRVLDRGLPYLPYGVYLIGSLISGNCHILNPNVNVGPVACTSKTWMMPLLGNFLTDVYIRICTAICVVIHIFYTCIHIYICIHSFVHAYTYTHIGGQVHCATSTYIWICTLPWCICIYMYMYM